MMDEPGIAQCVDSQNQAEASAAVDAFLTVENCL